MSRSVEERLADIEATCRLILAKVGGQAAKAPPMPTKMNGDMLNPTIRKDPPRWTGPSYAGKRFSDCPPDFLDVHASFLDWVADKKDEEGKKDYAAQDRRDANAARGWALRARAEDHDRDTEVPPF